MSSVATFVSRSSPQLCFVLFCFVWVFSSHQALRARVSWGQGQFQQLLDSRSEVEDVELEELRYRWMLHKSKLKDVGDLGDRLRVAVSPAIACRGQ